MAHVDVVAPDLAFDEPLLVDGLPGRGLVGKLVADHLVGEFGMDYYAGIHCEGVPPIAAYRADGSAVRSPVQLYADPDHDLLALTSDVPVSPSRAPQFAGCITDWLVEHSVTPIYLAGLDGTVDPDEEARRRELYGLSTGDGDAILDAAGIVPPRHAGIVTGPTGALLDRASEVDLAGVGLLVESDGEFPDLDAARVVVDRGIEPIAGIDIDTEPFVDRATELSPVAESALGQLHESDGNSRAKPTPTFH